MIRELRSALLLFVALTMVTGLLYPLTVTLVGRALFADATAGSVIEVDGRAVGSRLLGQPFSSPQYFWSRPSATAPMPYNGAASSGSNQGPINPNFLAAVEARVAALKAADPSNTRPVPIDLVTASGSGLDPHISVAAAQFQLPRVARARGLPETEVAALVRDHTIGRTLGVLGEPRVDVLGLNLALDGLLSR
jgi:K+-transporting ATPase ATPase C chain